MTVFLIKIRCPNGCQQLVFYENLNKHYLECLSMVTQTRSFQEENEFNAGNLIIFSMSGFCNIKMSCSCFYALINVS